jgi:hypothetical protein
LCQNLLGDASLYVLLDRYDRDVAETARTGGCVLCGSVVHRAPYPRKPRGGRVARLRHEARCDAEAAG